MTEQLPAVLEDMFADDEVPTVQEVVKKTDLPRDQARDFVSALRIQQEKDYEARISPDDHLAKRINGPLLAEITRITAHNSKLQEELEEAGPMSERTPEIILEILESNTKQLLAIKKTLSESQKSANPSGTNITFDMGAVFQEALEGARSVSRPDIIDT